MGLPIFLTRNSVSITIVRASGGTRSDIGELEDQTETETVSTGVFESIGTFVGDGRYEQNNQGKFTRQRFMLYVGPTVSLQTGDFVESGGSRYEVGVVTPYDSHKEAFVFKV